GDFVYFDPPYVPLSRTATFTAYAPGGFGAAEQARLANLFDRLARRGVEVLLSNSDVPEIRELYGAYRIEIVKATRAINSKGSRRGPVSEVLVTNQATRASADRRKRSAPTQAGPKARAE